MPLVSDAPGIAYHLSSVLYSPDRHKFSAYSRITGHSLSIRQGRVYAISEQSCCIGYIRASPANVQADTLQQADCTKLHEAHSVDPHEAIKELLEVMGVKPIMTEDQEETGEHHAQ